MLTHRNAKILASLTLLAGLAGCGEQPGPPDAELIEQLNDFAGKTSDKLLGVDCDESTRSMSDDNKSLTVRMPCVFEINKEHYSKVSSFVEATKAAPLAFGDPFKTAEESAKAEVRLEKATEASGENASFVFVFEKAGNGGWDMVSAKPDF